MNFPNRMRLWVLWGALAMAVAASAQGAAAGSSPAALDRPALLSLKAKGKSLLCAARAGTRLLVAGERGIVLYSDDQGSHWQQALTPTSVTLVGLRFVDARNGWALGHMGMVLHTEDGGATWVKQFDGMQAASKVSAAIQRAADGGAYANADAKAQALSRAERLLAEGADKPFFDMVWLDKQTAFLVGAFNLAFKTTDGGQSWEPWDAHIENPKGLHLYAIRQLGSALFIAGEQGLLLRSTDGGAQFKAIHSPYEGTWFGLLAAPGGKGQGEGEGALVAYGLRGNAYVSNDSGNHWNKLSTGTQTSISSATQLQDGRIVLTTQAGEILATHSALTGEHANETVRLQGQPGLPISDLVETPDGALLLASLRGVVIAPLNDAPGDPLAKP